MMKINDKGLCRAKHDTFFCTATACRQGKVEQVRTQYFA